MSVLTTCARLQVRVLLALLICLYVTSGGLCKHPNFVSFKLVAVFNILTRDTWEAEVPSTWAWLSLKQHSYDTAPQGSLWWVASCSLHTAYDLISLISCRSNLGANSSLAMDLEGDSYTLCIPWWWVGCVCVGSLCIRLYILTLRKIICKRKVTYLSHLLLANSVKVKWCLYAAFGPL